MGIWTTDDPYEKVSDEDSRALLREQLRRQLDEITQRQELRQREQRDRERREEGATAAAVEAWGRQTTGIRERMLGANWPEGDKREIGFLKDFLDGKMPKEKKEDKILKPLPDELFEI